LASDLHPVLDCAGKNLRDFCALDQTHYDQLLARAAPLHEFVWTVGQTGYQVILFQAQK
jgi:hypothetical protein